MPATIVVGALWGDEGKGRVADWLAAQADIVARYAGGDNAGHTIRVEDKTFKLRLIPSGILYPGVTCILGAGVVVNPLTVLSEMETLRQGGIEVTPQRFIIDARAHIITPGHIALDGASETALGKEAIGTTKRGIGPAYASKMARSGIRAQSMTDPEQFGDQIEKAIREANQTLTAIYGLPAVDNTAEIARYVEAARQLAPFVGDAFTVIQDALEAGQRVLCEGAQGTLLDINFGMYPFVTSSSPTTGGAITGLGIGPCYIDRVIGITKAFSTRVGSGPFPTELNDEIGERLRGTGENPWDEFGTVTGRPRRCGWLDGVILRYSVRLNGMTELVVNKLDVLSGLPVIKIAVAYEIDGKRVNTVPYDLNVLSRAKPIYEEIPGWTEDISNVRSFAELPEQARQYIRKVEQVSGVKVVSIGVGPARDQVILP